MTDTDFRWMQYAIDLAKHAEKLGEVPIGAVLVCHDQVAGEGYNQPIALHDPTAHAEIMALRKGGRALGNYRMLETTLYVTLEPCIMCVGAMVHARIARLVFGALDPKAGAITSCMNGLDLQQFNHRVNWDGEILAEECGRLLQDFFRKKRKPLTVHFTG